MLYNLKNLKSVQQTDSALVFNFNRMKNITIHFSNEGHYFFMETGKEADVLVFTCPICNIFSVVLYFTDDKVYDCFVHEINPEFGSVCHFCFEKQQIRKHFMGIPYWKEKELEKLAFKSGNGLIEC